MADPIDYRVVLSEAAILDLSGIGLWIAEQADMDVTNRYVARVETACYRLASFPNRGTPKFSGLRTTTFERSIIIAYRVGKNTVTVIRLIPAVRDYAKLLS